MANTVGSGGSRRPRIGTAKRVSRSTRIGTAKRVSRGSSSKRRKPRRKPLPKR